MDAFGLFSSGLFYGYTIIWAGGDIESTANGTFLIVTSIYCEFRAAEYAFNGIAVIKNGAHASVAAMRQNSTETVFDKISIAYSGSTVTIDAGSGSSYPDVEGWCGFIIA